MAKRRPEATDTSARAKGSLVEDIVAAMHEVQGVLVEKRIFLPVTDNPERKREIDVLLTSNVAGYTVRFAVECKNEAAVIKPERIDAFAGKLQDVGIPSQCGIYVSSTGYTSGALARATKAGITTLVLRGLTTDRRASEMMQAMQSLVYCLLQVNAIRIVDSSYLPLPPHELMGLWNDGGRLGLMVPDLIWQEWTGGRLPVSLGQRDLKLVIPPGLHHVAAGKPVPNAAITASVDVLGLVMLVVGKMSKHVLTNGRDNSLQKAQTHASFDAPQGKYQLTTVRTEQELDALVHSGQAHLRLTTRLKLPRILANGIYWPPSQRVYDVLVARMKAGLPPDLSPEERADLEGGNLDRIWDPIWADHPLAATTSPEG